MNKDGVRRILAVRYQPKPDTAGPSWLTVLGHAKDSLWNVDLFRCESAILRAHWVLVVMDQFTRRIVGFGVHRGAVDGVGLCRMFNQATRGHTPPTYLSLFHDRLYRFQLLRAEYLEIPRLRLTQRQAQRLWGLDRTTGEALLDALVDARFLRRTRGAGYVRADAASHYLHGRALQLIQLHDSGPEEPL